MDFYILEEVSEGETYNPYAGKANTGEWIKGTTSIDFLNTHFGEFDNATDMIEKSKKVNAGLEMFFRWLVEQGKLVL